MFGGPDPTPGPAALEVSAGGFLYSCRGYCPYEPPGRWYGCWDWICCTKLTLSFSNAFVKLSTAVSVVLPVWVGLTTGSASLCFLVTETVEYSQPTI